MVSSGAARMELEADEPRGLVRPTRARSSSQRCGVITVQSSSTEAKEMNAPCGSPRNAALNRDCTSAIPETPMVTVLMRASLVQHTTSS